MSDKEDSAPTRYEERMNVIENIENIEAVETYAAAAVAQSNFEVSTN